MTYLAPKKLPITSLSLYKGECTKTNWTMLYQVNQSDPQVGLSPNIELAVTTSGNVVINLRHGSGIQGDPDTIMAVYTLCSLSYAKGKWIDYLWNFKITRETDGWVKCYRKLATEDTYTLEINYSGQTGFEDCSTDYVTIKGGLYRGAQNSIMYLYQDEIRYGQTASNVKIPGSYLSEASTFYRLLNRWSEYALTAPNTSSGPQWYNRRITQAGGVNSGSLFLSFRLHQHRLIKNIILKNFCANLCCKNRFACKV